jgi:hypothetical protein
MFKAALGCDWQRLPPELSSNITVMNCLETTDSDAVVERESNATEIKA